MISSHIWEGSESFYPFPVNSDVQGTVHLKLIRAVTVNQSFAGLCETGRYNKIRHAGDDIAVIKL